MGRISADCHFVNHRWFSAATELDVAHRRLCGDQWMNGDVLQRVISTVHDVFDNKGVAPPDLTAQTPLDHSLGLESLDYAELVVRLEQEFGKDPFSSGTPPRVSTLGELASYYA